jgi:hypothetical protein
MSVHDDGRAEIEALAGVQGRDGVRAIGRDRHDGLAQSIGNRHLRHWSHPECCVGIPWR